MNDGPSKFGEMTAAEFARVRALFHRVVDLPASERAAVLDQECGDNEATRTSVRQLLAASDEPSDCLAPDDGAIARVVFGLSPSGDVDAARLPKQIGPYRIQRVIGQGGMGTVLLAEQTHPRREVALKVLRPGWGAGAGRPQSRFGREVRVLGLLEHPGIARIYEAGTAKTDDGPISYFAMEYVRGPRITDYAARKLLSTADRVELIAKVADAVQHAHARGVIHRDLKPGNILVCDGSDAGSGEAGDAPGALPRRASPGSVDAQPKILDFGVARLSEPESSHTALTEAGLLIGTVAYMSPEQLAGDNDAVDTRSDVYAMGVMLFELLTGETPHDVRSKPVAEAARIVRDEEPRSLNAAGNTTGVRFDRDLETIVAHAIDRNRDRRYSTAAGLADDLRRYLRQEPIQARPATAAYQLSKFARRHPGLVAGAVSAMIMLAAGLAVSTGLYLRAESNRRLAEQERQRADSKERLSAAIRDYMVNGLLMAAAPENMGHDVKMLDVLTQATEGLQERFADQPEVEASIRAELAGVLLKVGKLEESRSQWELAIPLMADLYGADDPRTIHATLGLSATCLQLKDVRRSIKLANDALDQARALAPDGAEREALIIASLHRVAAGHAAGGRFKRARDDLDDALDLAKRSPEKHTEAILMLMITKFQCEHNRPGVASSDEALDMSRQIAAEARKTFGEDGPAAVNANLMLLRTLVLGRRSEEAASLASELIADAERVFASGHLMRGRVYRGSAEAFLAAARFEDAEKYALLAQAIFAGSLPDSFGEQDFCIEQLRRVYVQWPGGAHAHQLRQWGMSSLASRLSHTVAERWGIIPLTLRRVAGEFAAVATNEGDPRSEKDCMNLVWQHRDTLAPPGHQNRAMFFANFARWCASVRNQELGDQAIALAKDALAVSKNPGRVANILKHVESARGQRPAADEQKP